MKRVVRFGETDPAGVVHFYQLFRWCHESWEESLENFGLSLADVFPKSCFDDKATLIALPIVHCEADFLMPLQTGDHLIVKIDPKQLDPESFQLEFTFEKCKKLAAKGLIRHVSIDSKTRKRCLLPENIVLWLQSSSVKG